MKLFIFGSTGDLVKRMIIPAFIDINLDYLEIIALGRKDFTDTMYEDFVCEDKCFRHFKNKPVYHKITFDNEVICEKCEEFLDKKEINFFYIAMPPKEIEKVLTYIGKIKEKNYKVKILIEKPFGESLKAAESLKKLIASSKLYDDVFISDHYLFKEEIVDLNVRNDFKKISIASLEKVGLENRSYYDDIGALKDMIQSHLLNIAFKLLENPEEEFRNFEILEYTRGQYGNGEDEGYVKDLGILSKTETFARVKLRTKNKEFEFISGKKFDRKIAYMEIDNKRINLNSSKNPYSDLFLDFFSQKKKNFTSIENSILAWKIINKIESRKPELKYYPECFPTENVGKI